MTKVIKKHDRYSGWLTEEIRTILRKHPLDRLPRDIDVLMQYFSTMRAFLKYNAQSRRQFLIRGRYERWGPNRHIIKEGHPAHCLYIILDGQVSISKIDKEAAIAAKAKNRRLSAIQSRASPATSLDALTEEARMAKLITTMTDAQFDDMYKIDIGKLNSGDAFGEVAFTVSKDNRRAATVTTTKKTEFLVIEISDAKSILKTHSDNSFEKKVEFIGQLPFLKSLRIDVKTLSYYCQMKTFTVDEPIITEGKCDHIRAHIARRRFRVPLFYQIGKVQTHQGRPNFQAWRTFIGHANTRREPHQQNKICSS